MRFLFTTTPGPSHFHSQAPIVYALRDAGHEVAFATSPDVVPRIAALGLAAFPIGPPRALPRGQPPADPRASIWWAWEQAFVGPPAAERLADLLPLCARWRP